MLKWLLEDLHLKPQVLTISGNRHFVLAPQMPVADQAEEGWGSKSTILIAHYDRVADSPGANDNSAAVFELIEAALRLRREKTRQWFIIFTDKEELGQSEGIRDQGSYTLARSLRDIGLGSSRVYIFDACGAGDTLIISTMADYLMREEHGPGIIKARHEVKQLRNRALDTVRRINLDRVRLIPTPFSDDAGFLRAGIVAQTITMLPAEEASRFGTLLRSKPDFADALVNRDVQARHDKHLMPETWRRLNGPEDNYVRLTPQYFSLAVRFMCALCKG
jgi:hypothetical protein